MEEKGPDALEMAEKKNAPKKKKAEVNRGHGVTASLWAPVMGMN